MPPKRKNGPSVASRHSKRAKKETIPDEVADVSKSCDEDPEAMKVMEEALKKKIHDDVADTAQEVLRSFASLMYQKVKAETSLDEAQKMFKSYDKERKVKDETIQSLKAEIESLKARETADKAEIHKLRNKTYEEEFRANQLEDNYGILMQEMEAQQEEITKKEEELKKSKEVVKNLESDKEILLKENQNLNVEMKQLKDDSSQNSDVRNRIESLEHEVESEAEERQSIEKELEKSKLQCEDLRTKLKEKSKETVELQVKSKDREAALSKCQRDFMKIEKQINEFLQIKEAKEKEFSGSQAKYSELMKKYQDLKKSKSEELSLINKKHEKAQKTLRENQSVIDQLRSERENDNKSEKLELEDKILALKRDLARLTDEKKEAEGKLLQLETERREDGEKVKSLEDRLKERDTEREKLKQELKDYSKRLQKKKDLIKKIEKKSHERKLRLKCYQDASFSDKASKDIARKDKKKVLTVKLVLNGEDKQKEDAREIEDCEEKIDQLNVKANSKKPSKMRIDTSIPATDQLLAESDDEEDKGHNDKDLKPLDVTVSCDDVIDTIGNPCEPPSKSHNADVDLNETDELQKIQEFLENTEIVGDMIDDMISTAVPPSEDSLQTSASTTEERFPSSGSESAPGLPQFYRNVRNAVRQSLLRYYQQEDAVGQFRIRGEKHFTELCRKFSHEFREELKDSYFREPEVGILSSDDEIYISKQIDNYVNNQ